MRLLVAFLAATLTMVGAIVLLLRGNSDWVDFVALALLLAVAVAVLAVIAREIREEEPPSSSAAPSREAPTPRPRRWRRSW